eukprot:2215410-Pleurochrysis_carterae.AAC.3
MHAYPTAFTVAATLCVAHVRKLLSADWQSNICWAGTLPAHLLRFPSARVGPCDLRNALPTDDSRGRCDSRCRTLTRTYFPTALSSLNNGRTGMLPRRL